MLIVQDKLISEELVTEQFVCNLNACKGACCWEGDFGAPLDNTERRTLDRIYDAVRPYLTAEGQAAIEQNGTATYFKDMKQYGTTLVRNAACAFLNIDSTTGIAQCGIEQAWRDGKTGDFVKPISCHLYPIRVSRDEAVGFEALNYDRWDICAAACSLGKSEKIPVYQFAKTALIRAYGEDFYDELDATAQYITQTR
jgi:hypothetical protein